MQVNFRVRRFDLGLPCFFQALTNVFTVADIWGRNRIASSGWILCLIIKMFYTHCSVSKPLWNTFVDLNNVFIVARFPVRCSVLLCDIPTTSIHPAKVSDDVLSTNDNSSSRRADVFICFFHNRRSINSCFSTGEVSIHVFQELRKPQSRRLQKTI